MISLCDKVLRSGKCLMIAGPAASGKTTLLLKCLERVPPEKDVILVSYYRENLSRPHEWYSLDEAISNGFRGLPVRDGAILAVDEVNCFDVAGFVARSIAGGVTVWFTKNHRLWSPSDCDAFLSRWLRQMKFAGGCRLDIKDIGTVVFLNFQEPDANPTIQLLRGVSCASTIKGTRDRPIR